jgi:hypothetical protein
MGGQFFAPLQRMASHDPLAGALNLPGSHTYANQQNQRLENASLNQGTYSGAAPTLAGANAGYLGNGPGSVPGRVNAPIGTSYVAAAQGASQNPVPRPVAPTNYGGW